MPFILPDTFYAVVKSASCFFFSAIVSGKQKYVTKKLNLKSDNNA